MRMSKREKIMALLAEGYLTQAEAAGRVISGDAAADLQTTYGFPIDLTEQMARELNLVCLQQGDYHDESNPDHFVSDWVILFRRKDNKKAACEAAALIGGLQPGMLSSVPWAGLEAAPKLDWAGGLPQRLNPSKWEVPQPTGRRAWTDSFQDVVRIMNW